MEDSQNVGGKAMYAYCDSVSLFPERRWIALLVGAFVAVLILAIVLTPAPLNVLKARLVFVVESVSLEPVLVDGEERTHFQALIRYENAGPVKVQTLSNLLVAALSDEGGVLFDTMNDRSSSFFTNDRSASIERGEVRTIVFDAQLTGSWDSAVFWVKVSAYSFLRSSESTGYFSLREPLILEI